MTVTLATLDGPEAQIDDESLEELRMTIRGDVLTPDGRRLSARSARPTT